jgi:hypothetical protein
MGMLEPGGEFDFTLKPLCAQIGGELLVEHLEGHWSVMTEVMRQIDGRHASAAELTVKPIASREVRLKDLSGIVQGSAWRVWVEDTGRPVFRLLPRQPVFL